MSSSAILAFQLGDRVLIEGPSSADGNVGLERSGTIKYIGKTEFKEGDWLGVELDTPTGKNDGSVAGVRYFTCQPFHGLFVPPNKARLNLSGDSKFGEGMFSRRLSAGNTIGTPSKQTAFGPIGSTPNHLDKIENLQMDFSAVKDISDSFTPAGLKTPTANVKSQNNTPATNELKSAQNDIFRLRDQIMTIKADLRNDSDSLSNRETVDAIVNKLSGMLETYEQVSSQYENQLKQFLMARKASKLHDSSASDEMKAECEKIRNDLYNEVKEKEQFKNRLNSAEDEIKRLTEKLSMQEEELQKSRYESNRTRTELEIEMMMEEEQRKRTIEHENEIKILKSRHDEEMRQKKIVISDLQNEVAFLKQSERVLEEELNSRRYRLEQSQGSSQKTEPDRTSEELFTAKRQVEEFKRLWEDAQAAKMRSEEYYRGELDRIRQKVSDSDQFEELKRDLKELGGRLKQTRSDNEELTWALETARKEIEKLNSHVEEQAEKLSEREKKLQAFSDRIRELENREIQSRDSEALQEEIKRLNFELGEERVKSAAPLEQVSALKRKIALIEREKELLEEQVRSVRLSAYSHGELQTFSTFIQGLKRHVEAEILSIEPLKLTLQDVVRAKEMVDILLKVTEDVRVKVLNHLSQVEEVIKARFIPQSTPETSTEVETVKIERVRNYDSNSLADLKRRIDFRAEQGASAVRSVNSDISRSTVSDFNNRTASSDFRTASSDLRTATNDLRTATNELRTLREPLGVTSIPSATNYENYRRSSASGQNSDYELENRMNNFRNLVSDLRSRQQQPSISTSNTSTSRPLTSYHSHHSNSHNLIRAQEPMRCNLCQEYGHDALACPDYLGGSETFSEDLFLKDVRNSKFNSRFAERTRV